jgi:hypothetical protein
MHVFVHVCVFVWCVFVCICVCVCVCVCVLCDYLLIIYFKKTIIDYVKLACPADQHNNNNNKLPCSGIAHMMGSVDDLLG